MGISVRKPITRFLSILLSFTIAVYPFHSFGVTFVEPLWGGDNYASLAAYGQDQGGAWQRIGGDSPLRSGSMVEFGFEGEFVKPGGLNMFDGYTTQSVAEVYDAEFCDSAMTVTSGAANETQCITVKDTTGQNVQICPGDALYQQLSPSPVPGIPKLALEVGVTVNCGGFNQGVMDCWVDINGDTQCPENQGDRQSTCGDLEADPQCAFVKTECIEGARGEQSGHCYAYEDEYDCGQSYMIPDYEKVESYQCGGPVRCMGNDCMDPLKPESAGADFGKVAALLDAAQSMAEDMECAPDGTGCKVFSGDSEECKTALGGWVNCCEKPKGVSLSDYIATIRQAPALDKALVNLSEGESAFQSIGQGYTAIRNPLANGFKKITQPISGYMENISGAYNGLKQSATDLANKVLTKAQDVIAKAMGKSATTSAGKQAAASGAQDIIGSFMSSPAGVFLQTVMAIYTAYQIANLIVNLIWKCTKKELNLGVQRQLKVCHKVGTYCKKKIIGACIEKRTSFCCFASPLSRILQEQIRPQIGMSFGSAKSPNCSGLPVEKLDKVNWERVNLDEWLGILQATNNFPGSTNMTIESMTGVGSAFDLQGDRLNSLDRNIERLDGADVDAARKQAEKSVPITTGAPTP